MARHLALIVLILGLPSAARADEALWNLVNITALTGIFPVQGELVVLTPQGSGTVVSPN